MKPKLLESCPAAILCRYSSHNQDQGLSIEVQLDRLLEYAKAHNYKIVKRYIEQAVSGMQMKNRTAFQEMLADSREKNCPFKAILVMKWDRYARNLEEAIVTKNDLRRRGFKLISVGEGQGEIMNPSTIFAERILDNFAEYESLQNAVRTIQGMQAAARRGFNTAIAPFGYTAERFMTPDKGEKSRLEINEKEAEIVRRIYAMFIVDKLGAATIRNRLNHEKLWTRGRRWTTMQILRILRNPKYMGKLIFGERQNWKKHPFDWAFEKVVIDGAHTPIIEKEDWETAQKMLGENGEPMRRRLKQEMRASDNSYLFGGLMECGHCGAAMLGHSGTGKSKKSWRYYVCGSVIRGGRSACKQRRIPAEKAERKIIKELRRALSSKENLIRIIATFNADITKAKKSSGNAIQKLQNEIQELDRKRRTLIELIEEKKISLDGIGGRLEELAAMKQKKELDLIETQKMAENRPVQTSAKLLAAWERLYGRLFEDTASLEAQKPLIQSCVISVRILDLKAMVTYSPAIHEEPETVILDPAKKIRVCETPSKKKGFARRESGDPYVTLCELYQSSGPQIITIDLSEIIAPWTRPRKVAA